MAKCQVATLDRSIYQLCFIWSQGIPHLMSLALSPSLATAAATMVSLWQCAASLSLWAPDPLSTKSHGPCKGRQHLVGVGHQQWHPPPIHTSCAWFHGSSSIQGDHGMRRLGAALHGLMRAVRSGIDAYERKDAEQKKPLMYRRLLQNYWYASFFGRNEALWGSCCIHLFL